MDDTGLLTISGVGEMYDYNYDAPWYNSRSAIKRVTIQDGVTSIGNMAFYGCNMTHVDIPNSVVRIGEAAFNQCIYLEELVLPKFCGELHF
ncbi:MAG: leucine-rich repeat domain-containing protein [Clostridia bacterium]|nr:leucine-rich repeat domain-containing protein [Clostridia bacterium]